MTYILCYKVSSCFIEHRQTRTLDNIVSIIVSLQILLLLLQMRRTNHTPSKSSYVCLQVRIEGVLADIPKSDDEQRVTAILQRLKVSHTELVHAPVTLQKVVRKDENDTTALRHGAHDVVRDGVAWDKMTMMETDGVRRLILGFQKWHQVTEHEIVVKLAIGDKDIEGFVRVIFGRVLRKLTQ